ncbi:phage antirepressor KilAC domain-containing protein [uncultured Parasutterella sp.]|uniref:phage antirepressor KilAC domain-containing protein n=1 Tax=uncultured Parasutterella sp. TaxID=1263098 RepID=UPI00272A3328|nr:phage antirepressor KilAC domain-containing protein [uncultured Parasutterella sp.]
MNELQIFNSDLIPVYTTDTGEKVVIGRELHDKLGINKDYSNWFKQMCGYGFEERKDFDVLLAQKGEQTGSGGHNKKDHILRFDMAKHICMIQRTETGKAIRQKLIDLEKAINHKDSYMIEDPIERAKVWIREQEARKQLEMKNAIQSQQIQELQPKASYYDVVLNCKDLLSISKIAKDFGKSARWLNGFLHDAGVQYRQGDIWLLYAKYQDQGYTSTKTQTFGGSDGEAHSRVHTYWTQKGRLFIYDLLKKEGVLPVMERTKA